MGTTGIKESDVVVEIHPSRIRPMAQGQPRTYFNLSQLKELMESIRENDQKTPAIVRRLTDKERAADPSNREFELIAGERRHRACTELKRGLRTFVVDDPGEGGRLLLAILENESRVDLSFYERAVAYSELQRLHKCSDMALARKIGKDPVEVNDALRAARLHPKVFELLHPSLSRQKSLRQGVALKLAGYSEEVQRRLGPKLVGMPWKKAEKIIDDEAGESPKARSRPRMPSDVIKLLESFAEGLGTNVDRIKRFLPEILQQRNLSDDGVRGRLKKVNVGLDYAMLRITEVKDKLKGILGTASHREKPSPRSTRSQPRMPSLDDDDGGLPSELQDFDASDD